MSDKTPEEIALNCITDCCYVDDPWEECRHRIAAAIAQERSKKLSWPNMKACKIAYEDCEKLGNYSSVADGWIECYRWLKSQIKSVELPTDEELDELAKTYEPDDIGGIRGDFKAGFRKAIELIKERVINQPR